MNLLDETGQNSNAARAIDNHSSGGLLSAVIQSAGNASGEQRNFHKEFINDATVLQVSASGRRALRAFSPRRCGSESAVLYPAQSHSEGRALLAPSELCGPGRRRQHA